MTACRLTSPHNGPHRRLTRVHRPQRTRRELLLRAATRSTQRVDAPTVLRNRLGERTRDRVALVHLAPHASTIVRRRVVGCRRTTARTACLRKVLGHVCGR